MLSSKLGKKSGTLAMSAHDNKSTWVGERGVPSEFLFEKSLEDHRNGLAADFICAFCNKIAADPVATSCEHYFWFDTVGAICVRLSLPLPRYIVCAVTAIAVGTFPLPLMF